MPGQIDPGAGTNNDQVKVFGIFGPVAMAGLGKARLPDSLTDRIIKIPMEPVKPGESVERFRQRILDHKYKTYRDALGEFCERADCKLDIEAVTIPETLNGRDVDNWEPLLAIAGVAGGDWHARAQRAAVWFCTEKAMTKRDTLALRLLKEVVEYLQEVTKASTEQIYHHLYNKSGASWRDFKFFNESWIRDMLYQFPGAPRQGDVRIGEMRAQGFHIDWFADLIERYITPGETPDTPDNLDSKNNAVGSVGAGAEGNGPEVIPLTTGSAIDKDPFAAFKDRSRLLDDGDGDLTVPANERRRNG